MCKKTIFKNCSILQILNCDFTIISQIIGNKSSVDGEKLMKIAIHSFDNLKVYDEE